MLVLDVVSVVLSDAGRILLAELERTGMEDAVGLRHRNAIYQTSIDVQDVMTVRRCITRAIAMCTGVEVVSASGTTTRRPRSVRFSPTSVASRPVCVPASFPLRKAKL